MPGKVSKRAPLINAQCDDSGEETSSISSNSSVSAQNLFPKVRQRKSLNPNYQKIQSGKRRNEDNNDLKELASLWIQTFQCLDLKVKTTDQSSIFNLFIQVNSNLIQGLIEELVSHVSQKQWRTKTMKTLLKLTKYFFGCILQSNSHSNLMKEKQVQQQQPDPLIPNEPFLNIPKNKAQRIKQNPPIKKRKKEIHPHSRLLTVTPRCDTQDPITVHSPFPLSKTNDHSNGNGINSPSFIWRNNCNYSQIEQQQEQIQRQQQQLTQMHFQMGRLVQMQKLLYDQQQQQQQQQHSVQRNHEDNYLPHAKLVHAKPVISQYSQIYPKHLDHQKKRELEPVLPEEPQWPFEQNKSTSNQEVSSDDAFSFPAEEDQPTSLPTTTTINSEIIQNEYEYDILSPLHIPDEEDDSKSKLKFNHNNKQKMQEEALEVNIDSGFDNNKNNNNNITSFYFDEINEDNNNINRIIIHDDQIKIRKPKLLCTSSEFHLD